jgi:exopolyphosphatase/guanosine-5'-triphosphate,3'-diphosphate pyrophosphatase
MSDELTRIGVVDVGSNSVRLVVFDGISRSPAYFYNEKVLCGLGAGLAESGRLNPEGRVRALNALRRFAALMEGIGAGALTGVATAAVREASDGPEFVAEVLRETGIELQVITGVEEAEYSAKGVLLGWPKANGLVCDIGGASMELAQLQDGVIGASGTSPLGPLKLQDYVGDVDALIAREVRTLLDAVGGKAGHLFLVGGSWRALARLDMSRRGYPFKVLHEYRLSAAQVRETVDWVEAQSAEELEAHTDTSKERLALVPMAARVMAALLEALGPDEVIISSYGLREGMLYEQMPLSTRGLDPLIEACRHVEATSARFPGFGRVLFEWLRRLYPDVDAERRRLILAACLLHDTSWQAHPDYRAEMCFEAVTRANLGGVDHAGRLFLGLAILSRYKNSGTASLGEGMMALLTDAEINDAVSLGKAMRLGAMISGAQAGLLDKATLARTDETLVLTLEGPAGALNGEVVEKRLASLARAMGLEATLRS